MWRSMPPPARFGFCAGPGLWRAELLIEDDGRGFGIRRGSGRCCGPCIRRRSRMGGNGLKNMRNRLREIGGECVIESVPGKGTRVLFRFAERQSW
jgi:signal transduction histidine kinase